MRNTILVKNYTNNAEAWWDAAHRACKEDESFPPALVPVIDGWRDETEPLEPHEVKEALDYCATLPGWDVDGENTPLLRANPA